MKPVMHAIGPVEHVDEIPRGTPAFVGCCAKLIRANKLVCRDRVFVNEEQVEQEYLEMKMS